MCMMCCPFDRPRRPRVVEDEGEGEKYENNHNVYTAGAERH